MSWSERHLLDVERLSAEETESILALASEMRESVDGGRPEPDQLRGQHLALLFAEPSTRTRLSFELAARRLGVETYVLDPGASSMVKGETFTDTIRNLDAIGFTMLVVRHHRSGAWQPTLRRCGGGARPAS